MVYDELVRMALTGAYLFHGSPYELDVVRPMETLRKTKRDILYRGFSVHATPYLYAACTYCASRVPNYAYGVDLYEYENEFTVFGPKSKKDALRTLYGDGGYIYVLDRRGFTSFEGIGPLELACFRECVPVKRFHLTYADWSDLVAFLGTSVVFKKK